MRQTVLSNTKAVVISHDEVNVAALLKRAIQIIGDNTLMSITYENSLDGDGFSESLTIVMDEV